MKIRVGTSFSEIIKKESNTQLPEGRMSTYNISEVFRYLFCAKEPTEHYLKGSLFFLRCILSFYKAVEAEIEAEIEDENEEAKGILKELEVLEEKCTALSHLAGLRFMETKELFRTSIFSLMRMEMIENATLRDAFCMSIGALTSYHKDCLLDSIDPPRGAEAWGKAIRAYDFMVGLIKDSPMSEGDKKKELKSAHEAMETLKEHFGHAYEEQTPLPKLETCEEKLLTKRARPAPADPPKKKSKKH